MKHSYYSSIQNRILLSMILVPFFPLFLSLAMGYYYFTNSLSTSTIESLKRIVTDHRQMIESFLLERTADLEFILNAYSYDELSRPEYLSDVFRNLQARSAAFVDLGVFDQEGNHVAYEGPYELKWKNYGRETWFQRAISEGLYISDIFLGYRKVPHFIIAVSKDQSDGRWAIRATIDTQFFSRLVEGVRIGRTGEAYLLNSEGVLQTQPRSGRDLMQKPVDRIEYPEGLNDIHAYVAPDATGEEYLYATAWLKDKEWLLVIRKEKADAFRSLRAATYGIFVISLLGLGAIVTVAFIVSGRIVQRMQETDTEKESLNQQLIRAQRLAELGEMAAGFAHEINNPLQIIRSEQALIDMNMSELTSSGALKPSESLAEIEDSMSQIKLQIDRCAGITQAILKFGRQSDPQMRDVDLKAFIPQVVAMVSKKASVNGIEIIQEIAENTPPVHGDPGQLQQVLVNLFNNAMDAVMDLHGPSGGSIAIQAGAGDDKRTRIVVRDNGCGIDAENIKKIFSPFFTTKPVGRGTGLGLAVCYGIINTLGGTMDVDSTPGGGSTFTISLPSSASSSPPKQ
ncbi:ATP-binding protein [Desulfococcus sp.]|uniref:sensor histidine kinase n=1 Tax=Desulfococcus sp. TaxID=2025834 RepID=UPI0035939A14